jgi:pimeloyl-ACP methyl ester carboxylesterase
VKLFFRKYGSGPPLFILHGLFGSSDNWVTIARRLQDDFTVYLPDLRNHGLSPHSSIHNYNAMRDDLYELVTSLKINKFFLAGHSMGGKTAIKFALKWPEMLSGLLIVDISPYENPAHTGHTYDIHSAILTGILTSDIRTASSREEIDRILEKNIPSGNIRALVMKNLRRNEDNTFSWKLNAAALNDNLDRIIEGIGRDTFMKQQVSGFPVIFLRGENSDYIPDNDISDIQKLFPAVEIFTVKGAGHWINAEKPEEVIKTIRLLKEN